MFALNGVDSDEKPDWQAVAAAHALLQKTTLIAGGPGTGKTTTAASLLHLVDQSFRLRLGRPAKVRLLAPTGKAAVRLADSIAFQLKRIETEQAVLEGSDMLPLSACLPANG
ncbi:AAA family ATPase, partial [Oleiphilus sp. HI0132]